MTEETKHSPLPFSVKKRTTSLGDEYLVLDAKEETIAMYCNKKDAELFVSACNSHHYINESLDINCSTPGGN